MVKISCPSSYAKVGTPMNETDLILRGVTLEDAELLWKWANDPQVRASSFSPDPIPRESHLVWLNNRLSDPNSFQFVLIGANEGPIGQVRFDVGENGAEIHLSVDSRFRGKGLGATLIRMGVQTLTVVADIDVVHAHVKSSNQYSMGAFTKAGFTLEGRGEVKGNDCLRYVWRQDVRSGPGMKTGSWLPR
jgi:UDP-2,4-diacetamido-2,4,6-trideoxy-beta-L-altropyranose hydrolase